MKKKEPLEFRLAGGTFTAGEQRLYEKKLWRRHTLEGRRNGFKIQLKWKWRRIKRIYSMLQ